MAGAEKARFAQTHVAKRVSVTSGCRRWFGTRKRMDGQVRLLSGGTMLLCVCVYIWVYRGYIHTYIHTYIYTYIHTHTLSLALSLSLSLTYTLYGFIRWVN